MKEAARFLKLVKVAEASVTMQMRQGKPSYLAKVTLERPPMQGEAGPARDTRTIRWFDDPVKEWEDNPTFCELRRALISLTFGPSARISESSLTYAHASHCAKGLWRRLRLSVKGFASRGNVKARVRKEKQSADRKKALENLAEMMARIVRDHPSVNRADVLRAFDVAKKRQLARTVMEE